MIDLSGHLRPYTKDCGFEDVDNYITINCSGYQKFLTKDVTRLRENGRMDYQIIYIVNGKGTFSIDNSSKEIEKGSIVLYHPSEKQLYSYYKKDNTEVYWIHFTGFNIIPILKECKLFEERIFNIGISEECINLFKNIINELQLKRPGFIYICNGYFLQLITLISRLKDKNETKLSHHRNSNIEKIISLMHSEYNKSYSSKDFAQMCNLSLYRFIHAFKEYTNLSPMEYLTKIRIDKSKDLLSSSSLSISEIANIVGYDNPLYFSRVFKKLTSKSPSEYKNLKI